MSEVTERAFRAQITPILNHFAIAPSATDAVVSAYSESWRSYHAMGHIAGMLHAGMRLPLLSKYRRQLGLLIIYHDVWYKIGREKGENERESAQWAVRDLELYEGDDKELIVALAYQGICATIDHTLEGVDQRFTEVVSFLLDLDLWGLGQPRARFQADTEAIWKEFQPRLTREEFDRGRSTWAAGFLERPRIYHTDHFRSRYEWDAIQNLRTLAGV